MSISFSDCILKNLLTQPSVALATPGLLAHRLFVSIPARAIPSRASVVLRASLSEVVSLFSCLLLSAGGPQTLELCSEGNKYIRRKNDFPYPIGKLHRLKKTKQTFRHREKKKA